MRWPWKKQRQERQERRAELESMSFEELSRLSSANYQEREEPRLREESRAHGDADWETATFLALLKRSLDRYHHERYIEDAAELGISTESKSDWQLSGEILREKVRRNYVEELLRG